MQNVVKKEKGSAVEVETLQAVKIEQPIKIYVDDGSTSMKVAHYVDGELELANISNNAQLGNEIGANSCTYTVNNKQFTFNPLCDALRTDSFHYQYDEHIVASVHHALHKLGYAGKQVHLSVTLPIKEFYNGSEVNAANIERKKAAMLVPVTPENEADTIEIVAVDVLPEAISALYPLLVKDGVPIVDETDVSIVFDFGGNSLDVVMFSGCAEHIMEARSFNIGMIEAYELIRVHLGVNAKLAHLKQLLEQGSIMNGKFTIDRVEVTKPIIDNALNQITGFIGDTIDVRTISHSFAIGGGAELLAPALKDLGFDCKVVPNPLQALVSSIAELDQ